jgi:hypothetical protein
MNGTKKLFTPMTESKSMLLTAILLGNIGFAAAPALASEVIGNAPTEIAASPGKNATNVATSTNSSNNVVSGTAVTATFSEAMNPGSINSSLATPQYTFTLKETNGNEVPGSVSMNATHTVATFTPSWSALTKNTNYTATITKAARSATGTAMDQPVVWSFTTKAVAYTTQAPVNLGTAGDFVILTKTGISNVPKSSVTGNMGVSPIAHTAITGFSETANASNTYSTSAQLAGKIYAADYAAPTPAFMTTSIGDMQLAYTNAAGRILPDATELGAGQIGGLTLTPGLYKWSSNVLISKNVTLSGCAEDVWILQIAGNLEQANATKVILAGGALAKNVFWQVAGAVSIGTTAHNEGIILSKTLIAMKTGASTNGRLLAQTAVTLEQNVVTQPAP